MKEKKFLITDIALLTVSSAIMTACGMYYVLNSSMRDIFGQSAENFGFALLFLWLPYIFIKAMIFILFAAGCELFLQAVAMTVMVAFNKRMRKMKTLLKIQAFTGISLIGAIASVLLFYAIAILNDLASVSPLLLTFLSVLTAICTVWQVLNFKAIKEMNYLINVHKEEWYS